MSLPNVITQTKYVRSQRSCGLKGEAYYRQYVELQRGGNNREHFKEDP